MPMSHDSGEMLTMDFGKKTVMYLGATLPTGTVGCEALNVPEEIITAMEIACRPLDPALQAIQSRTLAIEMLFPVRKSIMKCLDLMEDAFPSMRGETGTYRKLLEGLITKEGMANAIAYVKAVKKDGIIAVTNPQYKTGVGLLKFIPLIMQLPSSLRVYQERMVPFVEALQDGDRTPDGYCLSHAAYFPEEISFDSNIPGWEQMINVTLQYMPVPIPGKDKQELAIRMNHVSFVGMFRTDLYEGLRVGHAPKKCPICGKWFLTTDARNTKYCNGLAPDDPHGRTCRQYANWVFRDQREKANDDPIRITCDRVINNIDQRLSRGKLDGEAARKLKDIAKRKKERAYENHTYAANHYKEEMTVDALLAEAAL